MFLSARNYQVSLLACLTAMTLAGCDTCIEPGSSLSIEQLVGTYKPDRKTTSLLEELGLKSSPSILIEGDRSFSMKDMPKIWRSQGEISSTDYEQVSGFVGLPDEQFEVFSFDVDTVNGVEEKSIFAGSRLCETRDKISIEFAYRGWDLGDRLVFVWHET